MSMDSGYLWRVIIINNVNVTMPQAGFDPLFEQSDAEFTEWKTDTLAN